MIFNTHSHINDKIEIIDELIFSANNEGVSHLCLVGYDLVSSQNALKIANTYENVYAICGIQPCELDSFSGDFEPLRKLWNDNKCVAIGEIGLDYYYGKDDVKRQIECFEKQIKEAIKVNKPIVIHCRDAMQDTFDILNTYHKQLKGIVLHCYTGSVEMMKRFLSIGCYISLSGVVTFKNAKSVKEVATLCPLDRMLVETDDPYLAPTPFRGQENKPEYVTYVISEIAKLKNISFDEVKKATFKNALEVFNL